MSGPVIVSTEPSGSVSFARSADWAIEKVTPAATFVMTVSLMPAGASFTGVTLTVVVTGSLSTRPSFTVVWIIRGSLLGLFELLSNVTCAIAAR